MNNKIGLTVAEALFWLAQMFFVGGNVALIVSLFPATRPLSVIVAVFGFVLGVSITHLYRLIFDVPSYTRNDLRRVLSDQWKSAAEVIEELMALKGLGDTLASHLLQDPPIGPVYALLEQLTAFQDFERKLTTEGNRLYRLTPKGMRKKDRLLQGLIPLWY